MAESGFNIAEIGGHVQDGTAFHVPQVLWHHLPDAWKGPDPHPGSIPLPCWHVGPWDLLGYPIEFDWQLTKFMVLEVVAAVLMILIFVPLAVRIRRGGRPRGLFWNFFEVMLVFIRDQVARPAIGRRDADRFLPFLWNVFFFVLICNLLGLVPWAGSPTGVLAVTGTLALIAFCATIGSGMVKFGPLGFWVGLAPSVDAPIALSAVLKPMLIVLEVVGLCVKHCVLALRLLANMFAGHLVLVVIILFIKSAVGSGPVLWAGVTLGSVAGAVALSLLELLVAFLQAYIFVFLCAVFIGMAVHQH
jgi:F-type H+-transporting ATPase subunit a